MNTKSKSIPVTTLVSALCGLTLFAIAFAAASTGGFESTGTAPNATITGLYSEDDGEATTDVVDFTPNDEMALNFTVGDADAIAEIDNITIQIYDELNANPGSSDSLDAHMTYVWTEATDTWSGTQGTWAVDNTNSIDPGAGYTGVLYDFTLVFTPGKIANYNTTDGSWVVNITVYDEGENTGEDTNSTTLGMASYTELTASDASFDFGALAPGTSNSSATTPADGNITFQAITNDDYDLGVSATDWTNSSVTKDGQSKTIDLETVDSLLMNNDTVMDVGFYWIRNTEATEYDEQGQTTNDTVANDTDMLPYITVPSGTYATTYQTTYTVSVAID